LSLALVTGCSANLDVEYTDFFTRANDALDEITAASSDAERAVLAENLASFSSEVESLKQRAGERISEKMMSGKIRSDLTPGGTECEETLVFDDLNMRKAVALNGFIERWRKVGPFSKSVAAPVEVPRAVHEDNDNGRTTNADALQRNPVDDGAKPMRLNPGILGEMVELVFACNNTLR
jgi:hypothetical protein